jgi:OmpA-OmpF porin, OOP family
VSPTCDAKGDLAASAPDLFKLAEVADYLNTDGAANVKLTTAKDGTKHYVDLGGDNNLEMMVRRDGSGKITDLGGDRNLTVAVNKDGSGTLSDTGGDRNLTMVVKADGSGHLSDLGGDRNLTIDVEADGTGRLTDLGGDRNLTISIPALGRAELSDTGGEANLQVAVAGDGSGSLRDAGGPRNVEFTVGSDGAVSLKDTGGSANLELTVNADHSGSYEDVTGDVSFDFDSGGRATDGSGYVVRLPQTPVFSAPDRFPRLGKLGRLRPPCATVLRFAADVLFDFDKATLKPQAQGLIAKAAEVLVKAGRPIEVDGHTDAIGTDAYNDDLSVRRAEAFAAALKQHGVSSAITTKGWGEKRPVAPNTTAGGKDNPAGRALNRRVEVVLKN